MWSDLCLPFPTPPRRDYLFLTGDTLFMFIIHLFLCVIRYSFVYASIVVCSIYLSFFLGSMYNYILGFWEGFLCFVCVCVCVRLCACEQEANYKKDEEYEENNNNKVD